MESNFTPDQKLLALSWKQPFADLMLIGKIETRTWQTKYRGWVLICSSKVGYTGDQRLQICGSKQYNRITESNFKMPYGMTGHLGKAIAIGRLIDCRPMETKDEDSCFVKYHPDLFCHVYDQVQPLQQFIPWKGSQGWREVDLETKERIHKLIL